MYYPYPGYYIPDSERALMPWLNGLERHPRQTSTCISTGSLLRTLSSGNWKDVRRDVILLNVSLLPKYIYIYTCFANQC